MPRPGLRTPADHPSAAHGRSGAVHVPALGAADRYRDLAIAHRDLSEDHGPEAWEAFLAAYGLIDQVAEERYYRLLDELF
ncbi:hypothetical protein GCM10010191_74960 [Actinomadura vinacea]|uniref:Uncharacterized protein n=1 Tax=Actinomadura vinacea TaxID=115336 RepID=A0ABN3K1K9_9ACTN